MINALLYDSFRDHKLTLTFHLLTLSCDKYTSQLGIKIPTRGFVFKKWASLHGIVQNYS